MRNGQVPPARQTVGPHEARNLIHKLAIIRRIVLVPRRVVIVYLADNSSSSTLPLLCRGEPPGVAGLLIKMALFRLLPGIGMAESIDAGCPLVDTRAGMVT